jgi:hypothetical protein
MFIEIAFLKSGAPRSLKALKGHGFSRAIERPDRIAALAAEGMQIVEKSSLKC